MNSRSVELFWLILRSTVTSTPVDLPEDLLFHIKWILTMAKFQDVFLLICQGIKNNHGVLPAEAEAELFIEAIHHANNEHTLKTAKQILSNEKISYVPLKGAVIQDIYPQKWMRSSCDTDILVKETDLKRATEALIGHGFLTDRKKRYHDISFFLRDSHLELHFNICENIPRIDRVLEHVWENVEKISEYEYRESPEFFIFHIIAHLLYHFLRGGSNIKQFVDFWLLRKNWLYDEKKLIQLLRKCRLEEFYRILCETTDAWFGGNEKTTLTVKIENQVLRGGLEARHSDSDAISIYLSGGKTRYLFHSTFIPLREMKQYYPALEKNSVLLPAYYCKRLYSKLFGSEKRRAKTLLKVKAIKEGEKGSKTIQLLSEMGLD